MIVTRVERKATFRSVDTKIETKKKDRPGRKRVEEEKRRRGEPTAKNVRDKVKRINGNNEPGSDEVGEQSVTHQKPTKLMTKRERGRRRTG